MILFTPTFFFFLLKTSSALHLLHDTSRKTNNFLHPPAEVRKLSSSVFRPISGLLIAQQSVGWSGPCSPSFEDCGCQFFPKRWQSGCIKVNRVDMCRCVRVGGCGCMLGGWRWGSLAGSGPGRILKKIPDPMPDPGQRPFPIWKSIIGRFYWLTRRTRSSIQLWRHGSDFTYTKNSERPGLGFYLHKDGAMLMSIWNFRWATLYKMVIFKG